jgi:hypothetical protein
LIAPYELLLTWVSEKGEGSWQSFKQANDWLFNKSAADTRMTASRSATKLSVLSHLEIDWVESKWVASPPVLTILPDSGGHALLTGGRTRELASMVESATSEDRTQDLMGFRHNQKDAPDAYFIAADSAATVESLAQELGVHFDSSVAERLSMILPPIGSYLEIAKTAPAPSRFEAERFKLKSGGEWSSVGGKVADGLFRYDSWGKFTYRFVAGGQHYDLDLANGIYAELKRLNASVLSYRASETNGTLIVAAGAPLPTLHARAATLCTGLAPTVVIPTFEREYRNVPPEVAERIASSLGQQLQILEAEI